MKDEDVKKLVDEISFRLLATKKHPNHQWLVNRLKEFYEDSSNNTINKS